MTENKNIPGIQKIDVKHRQDREVQEINESSKIQHIIKNHLIKYPLFIKGYPKEYQTKITTIVDDQTIDLIIHPHIKIDKDISIYAILNKYVEIDLKLLQKVENHIYRFQITGSFIAKSDRESFRFTLQPGEAFINNIKTSKNIIYATQFTVPTSVKVIMYQYESEFKNLADEAKLISLDIIDPRHKIIEKTKNTYFLGDTQDEASYEPIDDTFVDLKKFYQNDINSTMRKYAEKKIRSEIIMPILYASFANEPVILGLIHLVSYNNILDMDVILQATEISLKIMEKIRVANTTIIKKRQDVLDIAQGGAKILISDSELAGMLKHQDGFVFDLYFRMQAPITTFAKIKNLFTNEQNHLVIGVDFEGHSSRKEDTKRLTEILFSLEKEYKDRQVSPNIPSQFRVK